MALANPTRLRILRAAPSANARSLAVLRIATSIAALPTGLAWARSEWELLPRELWYPPFGTRWAIDLIPVTPGLLRIAGITFLLSVVLVMIGYRARGFAALAVAAGLYAGWVPHFVGKVDHNHHIIWFLALLALAPCNGSLSIRRNKTVRSPLAYAVPAMAAVLILGLIYLSSGIPKVKTGLDWALSDNLRNLMWNHWWEKQYVPPLPLDEWPLVYKTFGLATIAFEMLFLPAALYPPTRKWIRWIGIGFHVAIRFVFAINFWTLAILYVALFDWDPKESEPAPETREEIALAPLALVLLIAVGALTIPAGWPLSAYPGFAGIAAPVYVDYELIGAEGPVLVTRSGLSSRYGPQKARPMAAAAVNTGREDVLLRHASTIEGLPADYYFAIERVEISTQPDRHGDP